VILGSFGLVLAIGTCFAIAYRRHLRLLRNSIRSTDSSATAPDRRASIPYPPPTRWVAVRSSNTVLLKALLRIEADAPATWSEALSRCREFALFVSPPVENWSLIIGNAVPDPVEDIDRCYRFLTSLSREIGDVQFFALDRVLNFHTWARLQEGRVIRAYSWSADVRWNEGGITLDERLLGLRTRPYAEAPEPVAYGEVSPEQTNTERLLLLARRWSIDPMVASEMIVHQEQLAASEDDRNQDRDRDPDQDSLQ